MNTVQKSKVTEMAKLAQLALTPDEVALFSEQIEQIVTFVDSLNEVDTQGVEPLYNPLYLLPKSSKVFEQSWREDQVQAFEGNILSAATHTQESCFLVPQVVQS